MGKRLVISVAVVIALHLATMYANGASAARYRVYEPEKSIEEILILLGAGVIDHSADPISSESDVIERIKQRLASSAQDMSVNLDDWIAKIKQIYQSGNLVLDEVSIDRDSVELYVDDQRQTVLAEGVVRAFRRVGQFIDGATTNGSDERTAGSVRLKYEVRVRGLLIKRETIVEDGHVVLITGVYGQLGKLDFAELTLDAKEFGPRGSSTHVVGTLAAHAPIGRCPKGPITRYAERIMADGIDDLLYRLQVKGTQLAQRGENHIVGVVREFVDEIQDGLR